MGHGKTSKWREGRENLCRNINTESMGYDTQNMCPQTKSSELHLLLHYTHPYLPRNQQSVGKGRYIHRTGHILQGWLSQGLKFCSRNMFLRAGYFTVLALGNFCVVLHGPWCLGLCSRSPHKCSTSGFMQSLHFYGLLEHWYKYAPTLRLHWFFSPSALNSLF